MKLELKKTTLKRIDARAKKVEKYKELQKAIEGEYEQIVAEIAERVKSAADGKQIRFKDCKTIQVRNESVSTINGIRYNNQNGKLEVCTRWEVMRHDKWADNWVESRYRCKISDLMRIVEQINKGAYIEEFNAQPVGDSIPVFI